MSLLNYFRGRQKNTASIAKERLQVIVLHKRNAGHDTDFLLNLQRELIEVIAKYVAVDQDQVKVELERAGNYSTLELNITLPNTLTE